MFPIAWIFDRLIEAAAISLVLFTLGSLAVLCCRQPVRRVRIILLTLAGSLLAPLVNLLPGLPHWSLPAMRSIAAPDRAKTTEHCPLVVAPVQLADTPSTSEFPATAAEPFASLGDAIGQIDTASEDQEPSSESRPALVLVLRRGFPKGPAPATRPIPMAEAGPLSAAAAPDAPPPTHTGVASIAPQIDLPPWIVGSYLAGAAALATWWVLGFAGLRRMLRTARPAPEYCRALLREIAGPSGDRVRLLVSPRAPQPFTFGWFQPVIVLPEEMTNPLELRREPQPGAIPPELHWSLAHEWSHVARGDVRVWSFAGLVRLVYYYQPLCWWLRRELRLCQDYLADAAAAQQSSPEIYAEFLAARGVGRPLAVGLGIAGGKSDLYRRIVMLVQNRRLLETHCPRWWTVAAATGAVALVALAATCGGRPVALAAADHPASSPIRGGQFSSNRYPPPGSPSFIDTAAEPVKPTDQPAPVISVKENSDEARKQKLLDGIFARAMAIKSGGFETAVSRIRDGNNTGATKRAFIVSGESWRRVRISDAGTGTDLLEVVRAGHHFSLTLPGLAGAAGPNQPARPNEPATLTIDWPSSATSAGEFGMSPPLQAGTIWHRATVPYLREHSAAARLGGTVRANEYDTQIVEWSIPADATQAAFFRRNALLSGGGIYRVYASEKLGYALAKLEYIDRFGTTQYVLDFSEFQELAPGIHFPRKVHVQEAGESWRMEILEAENVNEPVDDREFILSIPPRTFVVDNRAHRGEQRGIGDARKYPLRSFTTGAEYPDGLPAAMLAEMDRDAISLEELQESRTRASQRPANPPENESTTVTKVIRPEKAAESTAEKTAIEKTAKSVKWVQNLPDGKRLLYAGKTFLAWREVLLIELEPDSRMKALRALGALGANGYADEAAAAIAEILKVGSEPDLDGAVHNHACMALARLGTAGIPILESQLSSSDPGARQNALNALVSLAAKTDAVIPALLKAARDDGLGNRATVCRALAASFLAAPGVVEALTAALNNDEDHVRSEILFAIWHSKAPTDKTLKLLKLALHDADGQLRGTAAYLFGTLAPASAENAALLRQVLLSSTTDCVGRFFADLTNHGLVPSRAVAEMVVPSLIAIIELTDPNPKLNNAQHVELSLGVLNSLAREKASLAAIPVLIKGARGELLVNAVLNRSSFIETLGRFGPAAAEALPALKELLESEDLAAILPDIQSAIRSIEGKKGK